MILQNFWLSAPYGRNWSYLWSGAVPTWHILLLIIIFFIGVWAMFLLILGLLSRSHSWILPVFAIGLGAPRWCQMLWGTTFIGYSLPWADIGTGIDRIRTGLLVGKSLWLWLGVLDAIQGVGFGMMLLQVLSTPGGMLITDFDENAYCIYAYFGSNSRGACDYSGTGYCPEQSWTRGRVPRPFTLSS